MKSVFEVIVRRGVNDRNDVNIKVLAKNAAGAVEDALRHAKKNFWYEPQVILLNKLLTLDVEYKS